MIIHESMVHKVEKDPPAVCDSPLAVAVCLDTWQLYVLTLVVLYIHRSSNLYHGNPMNAEGSPGIHARIEPHHFFANKD